MKKVVVFLVAFFAMLSSVLADTDKNLVNIYLFHSNTCPHCQEEIKTLEEFLKEYDNIKIYKYEISDDANLELLDEEIPRE